MNIAIMSLSDPQSVVIKKCAKNKKKKIKKIPQSVVIKKWTKNKNARLVMQ